MPTWWDWNAVGAIGQWLGAIATFSAVVVALWAERRARSTHLSVSVAIGSTPTGRGAPTVIVRVVNKSGRSVILDGGIILLPDRRFLGPIADPKGIGEMRDMEKRECSLPAKTLAQWLSRAGYPRPMRLRFVMQDSTGAQHECRYMFDPTPWTQTTSNQSNAPPTVAPATSEAGNADEN